MGKIYGFSNAETGWTSIMTSVIFFGGVQLLTVGVLGQYIGILFDEVKARPEYIIDEKNNIPAYLQLYQFIRDDIVQGVYPYKTKLPSKRTTCLETGLSAITVEHAYDLLGILDFSALDGLV